MCCGRKKPKKRKTRGLKSGLYRKKEATEQYKKNDEHSTDKQ
jgi:hypothetical protein